MIKFRVYDMHAFKPVVINLWVTTPLGVTYQISCNTRDRKWAGVKGKENGELALGGPDFSWTMRN